MRTISAHCAFCGRSIAWEGSVARHELCPHCRRDLHCCVQCRFYDRNAHNQCLEPAAEWVRDKELNNFCDFYELREAGDAAGGPQVAQKAREAFENLFKKRS
ncbi:MAG: hypothetical protein ACE5JJ_05375 [Nitrospinota bacterium]